MPPASSHTEGGRPRCSGLDLVSSLMNRSALDSTPFLAGTGRCRKDTEHTSSLWSHNTCLFCSLLCTCCYVHTTAMNGGCTLMARVGKIWSQSCGQSGTACSDTGPFCHCTSLWEREWSGVEWRVLIKQRPWGLTHVHCQ